MAALMKENTMATQYDTPYLANKVRQACIRAALEGYEHASMSGLCHEGAWEAAISAMEMLDLNTVLGKGASN